jgi:hypothetical protein
MILGLILAVASALATNVAFLFKHRGAVLAPPIRVRHPLRSAADLFRSRWFAVGWMVAIFAWGLHVGALSLAPLSVVQAVLSGGLVFLAVLAERFFGFQLGRRQWLGVTITAAGLAVIGLTGTGANTSQRPSLAALIAIEGLSGRQGGRRLPHGPRARRQDRLIVPVTTTSRGRPRTATVAIASSASSPRRSPALTPSRTASSISRCAVTPSVLRNLRTDMFRASSSMAPPASRDWQPNPSCPSPTDRARAPVLVTLAPRAPRALGRAGRAWPTAGRRIGGKGSRYGLASCRSPGPGSSSELGSSARTA